MEYHQITLNEWMEMKDRLRRELNNVRQSYVRVGYILRKMDESKAYEAGGYKSVAEFAEKEHGLKPSTTSRWMSINKEYSLGGYSEHLDPKYIDMNASQLTEMLGLPMEDRDLIKPDTSREEIRELKRFNKEDASAGTAVSSPMQEAFIDFLNKTPEAAARVQRCLQEGITDPEHLSEAVAPGGTKMFRSGTKFITFALGQPDIKVKSFGEGMSSVSWSEFAEAAAVWMESHVEEPAEQENGGEHEAEDTGEQHDETERQGEIKESEDPVDGEAEEDADERPEAEPESGMNPPLPADVDKPEEIAPAQLSAEILEKNEDSERKETIVDEAGQPAPETDEEREQREKEKEAEEKARREKVNAETEHVNKLLTLIEKEIDVYHWTEAEEYAEKLLKSLAYLRENDVERLHERIKKFMAGGGI